MAHSLEYVVPPDLMEELAGKMPADDGGLLLQCASAAFGHLDSQQATGREDARSALTTLSGFGLVVTKAGSSHFLANYIARCLNGTTRGPFRVKVTREGDNVEAEFSLTGRLLLRLFSTALNIDIFLFSSRARPRQFIVDNPKATIALFHIKDSFLSCGEFVVIAPSTRAIASTPLGPIQPSPRTPMSTRPAVFRVGKRKRAVSHDIPDLDSDTCQALFKQACLETLNEQAKDEYLKIMARMNPKKTKEHSSRVNKARTTIKERMLRWTRLPPNTLTKTTEAICQEYGVEISSAKAKASLGDCNTLEVWRDVVNQNFEGAWELTTIDTGSTGSSQRSQTSTNQEKSLRDEWRTCTATFRQILRPELQDRYGYLCNLIMEQQTDLTKVLEEISIVALKTTHIMARGDLFDDSLGPIKSDGFDIQRMLPGDFQIQNDVPQTLHVAAIPESLQQHLEENMNQRDDLSTLLSKEYLQFAYARLISASQKLSARGSANHPLWQRAVGIIDTDQVPKAPGNMSRTILAHLGQYATAIENLWNGGAYKKALDYLLRVLLRLHLAPTREKRSKDRAEAFSREREQKAELQSSTVEPRLSKSLWRSTVSRIMDEIADSEDKNKPIRTMVLTKKLYELYKRKPIPGPSNTPPIPPSSGGVPGPSSSSNVPDPPLQASASANVGGPSKHTGVSLDPSLDALTDASMNVSFDTLQIDPLDASLDTLLLKNPKLDAVDLEDMMDDENEVEKAIGQDASRARLRALQVMLKTLLESPFIQERINPNYVKKMAFHGSPLTDKECIVVAVLADVLRPYVPKRRPLDSGGTAPPLAHPTLMAPLVFIANSVLRATGYSHFARLTCPEVSPSSLQALHMGPAELYEVFCTNEEGRFDVNDARGRSLTSFAQATMPPENKRAIFEAFFDLPKIAQICDRHGLDFADRLVFVDRHCVRILGKEKEYSQDHSGYRRRSKYEERRKQKKYTGQINWNEELDRIQWTKDRAESQRTEVSQQLRQLELTVRQLRDELAVKEKNKSGLSQSVHERRKNRDLVEEGRWYYALRTYNKSVRRLRSTAMEKEAELRRLRQEQYYWTKVLAVSQVASKSAGEDELPADTVLTPNRFAVEDSTERLDLTQLPSDQVVFAGTDYGIVTMSETVPQTLSEIQVHLNRFALLFDQVGTDAPSTESPAQAGSSVAATATKRSVTQQIELEKLRLPRSHRITAKQINDISHSEKSARKRNRRLRSHDNRSTREAIEQLSNRENVLKTANSLGAIDSARRFHRSVEDDLKAFEASNARQRDLRNQRLRTAKAWAKLGATERTHVREHVRQHDVKNDRALVGTVAYGDGWCDSCLVHHIPRNSGGRFGHILQCPKEEKKYFKVMLIGDAGTGVGSRIKGHARRGGGKMRKEHRQHCTVGITSEYRSSKTCIFCFQEVRLACARRVIRGEVKTVKVHGAVECVNPKCPSLKCGYSIRPRDVHSAVAIAIAGASNLLSPERATLTPFKRQLRPLGVNPTTKNTSQTLELLSSSSSSRRIPGEPLADRGVL